MTTIITRLYKDLATAQGVSAALTEAGHDAVHVLPRAVDRAERLRQVLAEKRAVQPAEAQARGDEAEKAARLLAREDVRHQAPEHRDHEQVVHADPDEIGARDPGVVGLQLEPEPEAHEHGGEDGSSCE